MQFAENQGIQVLARLMAVDDPKIKSFANLAFSRAARTSQALLAAKDISILPIISASLLSSDVTISSSAAIAIATIGKIGSILLTLEQVQIEILQKSTIIEILVQKLSHESVIARSEFVHAISSLCENAKIRTKVKALDIGQLLSKFLNEDDIPTVLNSLGCISMMSEDYSIKMELISKGIIPSLMVCLEKEDTKVIISTCMTISRICQECNILLKIVEGQMALERQPPSKGILKFAELLSHPDLLVCRSAAYAISSAVQNHVSAKSASKAGILDKLITLSHSPATNFAADALEKILRYDLSAKYWLHNRLDCDSLIQDGFYDVQTSKIFPLLQNIQHELVDQKREVLLCDSKIDIEFQGMLQYLNTHMQSKTPYECVALIAEVVSARCGGVLEESKLAQHPYKFRISQLKIKANSNVLLIGKIDQGTYYHRALLFKALCDRLISHCSLERGEYNRAWNTIDLRHQVLLKFEMPSPQAPIPSWLENLNPSQIKENEDLFGEPVIVDLMFCPGKLIKIGSAEAIAYQRI